MKSKMGIQIHSAAIILAVAVCIALTAVPVPVRGEIVIFPVVGIYDGSTEGNIVDRSALFFEGSSSGVGNDPSLVLDIDFFRDEILEAFIHDSGGVVSFDNAIIQAGSQTDSFAASFSLSKMLVVKNGDHIRTDFNAPHIFTPVSDNETNGAFLAKSIMGRDQNIIDGTFDFTFEERGFYEGEHVQAVAGTILGRDGSASTAKWLMKITLDNGDSIAAFAEIDFRSGNAFDDTFFGARAPEGRYITGVTWISLGGKHSGLDSFAFITNAREISNANVYTGTSVFGSPQP